MAYTALYRKYRPTEFEDVKGQDHIVTTLQNQVRADRIGHAYLFCGTRGTGKTTVAKILARAVNCEHPVNGSPCGECAMCRSIAAGSSLNVIEIDAASNNGVDDVRQIREEVSYPPTEGRYKVYIIDEVHMLSVSAFNALLKTLEEPPAYVVFILATTEPHKLPVTILSRCQRYDFHRITIDTIAGRLQELIQKEGIEADDAALRYIARAADGSMRDGMSLLDQCISFYLGQKLTLDHVLEVLGAVDTTVFAQLLEAVLEDDAPGAIAVVEELVRQGRDLGQFVNDFIWYLRNLLLVRASDRMEDILDMSSENLAVLRAEAEQVDETVVMRYIRIFSELSNDMRYASQKRVLLEIAILKLCRPEMEEQTDALADRISRLERKIAQGAFVSARPVNVPQDSPEESPERPKAEVPRAIPEELREIVKNWRKVVQSAENPLKAYLNRARLSLSGDNKLMLVFEDDMSYTEMVGKDNNRIGRVEELIEQQFGRKAELEVKQIGPDAVFEEDYIDLERFSGMDVDFEDD